jgi:hypothetical protein
MAVVADARESLSPQAADLIRRVARVVLDEPADLMTEVHAAVLAAADEPLRSEPTLAAGQLGRRYRRWVRHGGSPSRNARSHSSRQ